MNEGIMSGMAPVRMQEGGDAGKRFMNPQRTADGSGANLRDFTDLIFDPTDPVDYALLPLLVFPPAAIAARLIKMGVKGGKLAKSMKKVETIKDAQRSAGAKAKDLFTTDPVKNMAAANGLLLGSTRASVTGVAGQMTARNELADLGTTNERSISRLGNTELYSKEARDQIRKDPSLLKKGGINDLVELAQLPSEIYDIAKDPEGREAIGQMIKESIPESISNFIGKADKEIINRRNGGIVAFKAGGLARSGKKLTEAAKKKAADIKKAKELAAKKKTNAAKADKPKSSATKINEKLKPKTQTPAQKKAAAERKRQAANRRDAKKRQADIDAKTKANTDARRKADTDEFNQGRQQTPATKVDDVAKSGASKLDDAIQEGNVPFKNTLTNNPITRNKTRSVIGAGIIGTGLGLNPFLNDDDYDGPDDDGSIISDDENQRSFDDVFGNNFADTNLPDKDPSAWAQIMKDRIVNDRGIPLDNQGNFTTKPKFMDYLKSLPGAYSDKVQRDPDFAKKMMAGFLNMMKPVEGFVPINSAVAFGEGYLGEESRQSDMLPADAKMMEYLKSNPEMYDKYLEGKAAEAGLMLSEVKQDEAQKTFNALKDNLMTRFNIPFDKDADYKVMYDDGTGRGSIEIDSTGVQAMGAQAVSILARPGYSIELR